MSELASSSMAWIGLLLVVGGLSLAPFAAYVARRIFPGRNVFFARWGFSHVLLLVGIGLFVSPMPWLVAFALPLDTPPILRQLVGSAFHFALLGTCVLIWAVRLDPSGWRCLGLWKGRHLRALGCACASYVLLFPALQGANFLWPWLLERLGGDFGLQEVMLGLGELQGSHLVWGIVLAVLVQPFFEELLFRSFLQPLLVQNLGDKGGVSATSFLFALLHGAQAFLPIFALSLVIGAVMLRTQRLAAAWAIHAINNGLTIALLLTFREQLA